MNAQQNDEVAVLYELSRCRKWVEDALEYSGGSHNFDDVVESVLKGEMQLWPGVKSAIVTSLNSSPRKKTCTFFLAGGDLGELKQMSKTVEDWAKRQSCDGTVIIGRPGWAKAMKDFGYESSHIVLSKEF